MTGRPHLLALELAEDPDAWAALGFAVRDGRCTVGSTTLLLRGGDGGIASWSVEGLAGPVAGLPAAGPIARGDAPAGHPNGACAVDHVVVSTADLDATVDGLEAAGLPCRGRRQAGELHQAFHLLADALVEVVAPAPEPGPARFWGLTLVVGDLDACAALLGDRLGRIKDAVQPGRRIATVRPRSGVRLPLAFITPRV